MDRLSPLKTVVFVAALVGAGVGLGKLQNQERSAGRVDVLTGALQAVVVPVAAPIGAAWDSAVDFVTGMGQVNALRQENRLLRRTLRSMEIYAVREQSLVQELGALRSLAAMPNFGRRRVFADVVGYFPYENRALLNVGSKSGVRPGLAVVAAGGLLGVVQNVGPDRAQVTLLTSPTLRVGALIPRNPPVAGIVRGEAAENVLLEFLDTTMPVEVGNWVVTSGFSATIPRGVPIGRVIQVQSEPDFGARRARVAPQVRIGEVREVVVLL